MFSSLSALYGVFKAGQAVDNPAAWKRHQISANAVAAILLALVKLAATFGHPLPIDENTAKEIAVGVLAVVNVGLTVATSDKVGLPNKDQ